MKLSVVVPVYNEKETLLSILDRIKKADAGIQKEIILIDDFSTDGTRKIIESIKDKNVKKVFHKKNMGKGAAVKSGIKNAKGDIIIIQDADMEYNPDEYSSLIKPILLKKAKVVYGSRILKKENKQGQFMFFLGGHLVTLVTNILFLSRLTDEPTCYKVFRSDIIKKIKINGNRFEWEPEITAKILKRGIRIHEVPISYNPRKKSEGKKINWRDGVQAIWTLFKYRFKE